ncbi:hypothetical protein [Citrobacter sp. wls613]|uniref:hypothetical protein n=1 Tax=Citrobacter sp. wls613 TaxID=2576436 RepID=UPI0010CA7126|nr:hypothetical protein [Citrobacter sp. wls613]TKV21907.1 hypothetical protein FDX01_06250 [Citrobacter sp. wls613]
MSILDFFILILILVPLIVVGVVARSRGRNVLGWLFLSVVLSPTVFAPWVIVIILLVARRGDSDKSTAREKLDAKHSEDATAVAEYEALAPLFIARYLEDESKHAAVTSLAETFEAIGDPYSDKVAVVQKIKLLLPLM